MKKCVEVINHCTEKKKNSEKYEKRSYSWQRKRKVFISFCKILVKPLQNTLYSSGKPCSRRILIQQMQSQSFKIIREDILIH